MKNKLCFDVLKRLFAIVLCAAISVAYLPLLGQGEEAYAQSGSWEDNVKTIQFTPAGGTSRTVYKTLHSEPDEEYDEEGPTGNYYDYYSVPFWDGDKVVATLLDGTKKTLIYDGNNYEWKYENGSVVTDSVPWFTEPEGQSQNDIHWQVGNTYNACVAFGNQY